MYNNNRAFTLIELLVVVLIIGILAAIALPQYQTAVLKSKVSSRLPLLKAVADAEEMHKLATGSYTRDLSALDVTIAGNCSGDVCQVGDDILWLTNSGSVALYINSTSVDGTKLTVNIVYDEVTHNNENKHYTVKKGQFICLDRGVESKFRKACQSLSSVSFDYSDGGTGGKVWLF
jgi:prepilin-type N-terminal cleavage/methylation domain-containing protein